MRSYDEALAAAKDKPAFSNGSEGHAWTDRWCDTCVHDRSARVDSVKPDPRNNGLLGCALLGVAIMGQTPAEWTEQPWKQIAGRPEGETAPELGGKYVCSEYEEDRHDEGDDDPEPEPEPPPVVEGQLDLIDAYLDTAIAELTPAGEVSGVRV